MNRSLLGYFYVGCLAAALAVIYVSCGGTGGGLADPSGAQFACSTNDCAPVAPTPVGVGRTCGSDADCNPNTFCSFGDRCPYGSGTCTAKQSFRGCCTATNECISGTCNPNTLECGQGTTQPGSPCGQTADCSPGNFCAFNDQCGYGSRKCVNQQPDGSCCTNGIECQSGTCDPRFNVCGKVSNGVGGRCSTDSDCNTNLFCSFGDSCPYGSGVCTAKQKNGSCCTAAAECGSGQCDPSTQKCVTAACVPSGGGCTVAGQCCAPAGGGSPSCNPTTKVCN